jgi:predicted nucleotidyltransferase
MDSRRAEVTTSRAIDLIAHNRAAIAALCDRYGVEALDVFGSAATGAFDETSSDVDFIARFADTSPGLANRYLDFAEALERLLGRPVDVMYDRPIMNPYLRRSVEASREKVFERAAREETV